MSTMLQQEATQVLGPQAEYFQMLQAGVFKIQRCDACRRHVFFPRTLCPHCGGCQLAWVLASGKGRVYSTTIVRRESNKGGDYNISLVDLDEGVRVMANITAADGQAVRIDQAVVLNRDAAGQADVLLFTVDRGAET